MFSGADDAINQTILMKCGWTFSYASYGFWDFLKMFKLIEKFISGFWYII
jgi:hypothetical protein